MNNIKAIFPIFKNNKEIIYLDNAATTQKPEEVINSIVEHYTNTNSNVHRGIYKIAHQADIKWEEAHNTVAKYINAKTFKEIFFTKNTTEGLNWIANTVILNKGDVVVISEMEHHSNILPWIKVCKEKEAILERLKVTEEGTISIEHLQELITTYGEKIKVVSVVHQSNVLGTVNPVEEIFTMAKKVGALTVLDAAQSMAHMEIDVQKLGCDVLTFSSHKIYGPSGVGGVYCKEEFLNTYEPWQRGGEMVKNVEDENIVWNDLPWKYEAGTPAIEAGIGLGVALTWLKKTVDEMGGWNAYVRHEKELTNNLILQMSTIKEVQLVGGNHIDRQGIVAFNIEGIHPHDIASLLDDKGICVRAGYHCAQPLHKKYNLNGSTRVSLGIYNTKEELEYFVQSLKEITATFNA